MTDIKKIVLPLQPIEIQKRLININNNAQKTKKHNSEIILNLPENLKNYINKSLTFFIR